MKKTIRNHIDTNTTRRLAEGLILERRVTENGIDRGVADVATILQLAS